MLSNQVNSRVQANTLSESLLPEENRNETKNNTNKQRDKNVFLLRSAMRKSRSDIQKEFISNKNHNILSEKEMREGFRKI